MCAEKSILSILKCPVCHLLPSNTRYYVCPTGHTVCGICQPRAGDGSCPVCQVAYHQPLPRNLMLEKIVEQLSDLDPGSLLECDSLQQLLQPIHNENDGIIDILECPVCRCCISGAQYFMCPNGHNTCEACQAKVEECPQCSTAYPDPPTRNLMLEQIIAKDQKLKACCRNFPRGCTFVGNVKEREQHDLDSCKYSPEACCKNVSNGCTFLGTAMEKEQHERKLCQYTHVDCPEVSCDEVVSLKTLQEHMEKEHGNYVSLHTIHGGVNGSVLSQMDSSVFSREFAWPLSTISTSTHTFYLCRKMCPEKTAYLIYLVVNASKEVANSYRVGFMVNKSKSKHLNWTGNVFSICEKKADIWKSPECLTLSESIVRKMWKPASSSSRTDQDPHILDISYSAYRDTSLRRALSWLDNKWLYIPFVVAYIVVPLLKAYLPDVLYRLKLAAVYLFLAYVADHSERDRSMTMTAFDQLFMSEHNSK